ncbi:RdgB/HAM1 family non-canonical purine NTP pyrophosphatase [Actinobacteria bacterium YIM 96077]|uniref:dITP/XTP pyrophosphatase n=1 Tax=Phytoactinopolyspora halophila TaxID=1981511 RepID=A0A329R212_9ACTN|nr:RdgB/HAM1 family non-canonical purine NTP pyrophosphatase [Phytoactinopolyspora halophila]AYY12158.1 RdgB/HAM1 family non-canonical purine NTP pyrophosphatase [Actinobacteria bacterium YIM 96077]RAW18607.1 non-canonical purine NTP pyrophosphatase, RdgB/HAM1 family [Phytoactinopolyspora halophila]
MTSAYRIVLATHNQHKVPEIRRILSEAGAAVELVSLAEFPDVDDVVETGLTFTENALLKARAVAAATGLPALADDSGISVAALNGMPGVFSGRWCGRHGDDGANLQLLLDQIRDVPDAHRQAAFVCVAALVTPDGTEIVEEGRVPGTLTRERRGDGGFGYDPIFVPDGDTRTTAEMSAAEKDAISHRGRAFRAIAREIPPPSRDEAFA